VHYVRRFHKVNLVDFEKTLCNATDKTATMLDSDQGLQHGYPRSYPNMTDTIRYTGRFSTPDVSEETLTCNTRDSQ